MLKETFRRLFVLCLSVTALPLCSLAETAVEATGTGTAAVGGFNPSDLVLLVVLVAFLIAANRKKKGKSRKKASQPEEKKMLI